MYVLTFVIHRVAIAADEVALTKVDEEGRPSNFQSTKSGGCIEDKIRSIRATMRCGSELR